MIYLVAGSGDVPDMARQSSLSGDLDGIINRKAVTFQEFLSAVRILIMCKPHGKMACKRLQKGSLGWRRFQNRSNAQRTLIGTFTEVDAS